MNMIQMIIKDVEQGKYPKYIRSFNNTFLYEIYKGKVLMYDEDKTMPGVTVKFQNHYEPSTTNVYCTDLKRANEIIEYQETNRVAIHEQQKSIGEYIVANKMQ